MKTIIAEKPSVAREIARIVGATKREEGYFEGGGYAVTWAFGHLVQLAMPDGYGVGSVCCVSAFLQTSCPTFIVGYFQFEQRGITWTVDQKTGVVFVRLFRILIFAETFSAQVIVVIDTPTPPVGMTFDAEVVVRFACQLASPGSRLQ